MSSVGEIVYMTTQGELPGPPEPAFSLRGSEMSGVLLISLPLKTESADGASSLTREV